MRITRSRRGWPYRSMKPGTPAWAAATRRTVRMVPVLLLGIWLAGPVPAQSSLAVGPAAWLTEAQQHFAAGNELADAGRDAEAEQEFRAALLRYEGAAEALGRSNGFLLYNLGNTYLRLGDVGRAVLHYREAQRFIPSDPNLRQSLRHARSLRRDRIGTDAAGSVLRLVFFWHHTWSLQVRVTLFLAAANLLWLLALLHALGAVLGSVSATLPKSLARLGTWLAGAGKRQDVRRRLAVAVLVSAGVLAVAVGGSLATELLQRLAPVAAGGSLATEPAPRPGSRGDRGARSHRAARRQRRLRAELCHPPARRHRTAGDRGAQRLVPGGAGGWPPRLAAGARGGRGRALVARSQNHRAVLLRELNRIVVACEDVSGWTGDLRDGTGREQRCENNRLP